MEHGGVGEGKFRVRVSPFARKIVLRVVTGVVIVYLGFGASVWWAMRQPPETFGRFMARMPGPAVFLLFPFETFWTHVRAGTLQIGDPAPDFRLTKLDKSAQVQLAAFSAQRRPVVLVFGSYT